MQKILLAALLGGASFGAHAQASIKAGTVQLGGNINYNQRRADDSGNSALTTKTQNFFISPSIGYFVADNLAVGINFAYSSSKTDSPQYGQKSNQISVGPFIQYYRMFTEQFGLVGTLGTGFTHSNFEYLDTNFLNRTNGFYSGITPSIIFFPIPKIGIGASFGGINYMKSTSNGGTFINGADTSSTFIANFGLDQLTFSGTYYFGR